MFSNRTHWDLTENDLAASVRAHRAAGRELADLTVSNPTLCGFDYDPELLSPLASPSSLTYTADPLGMLSAREAVAAYYLDHAADVPTNRICLTTSTSEAYSFLFRLLFDPGDEILVARPSYPLFDFIAQLDNVTLREYPLHYDPNADPTHNWYIDLDALRSSISAKTRAIILVHPNNPTGNFASATERAALEALCAEQGIALIVDEVFLDYAIAPTPAQSFATGNPRCLSFILSGISKICALPQMKASWIATAGPAALVEPAMARLEVIADTFLSMNAPIQNALPFWLAHRHSIQQQIRDRITENLTTLDAHLDAHLAGTRIQRLPLQAGWTTILRVPRTIDDQDFAQAALANGVLIQPGTFYSLPEGRAVLSLLTPPATWSTGLNRLPIR